MFCSFFPFQYKSIEIRINLSKSNNYNHGSCLLIVVGSSATFYIGILSILFMLQLAIFYFSMNFAPLISYSNLKFLAINHFQNRISLLLRFISVEVWQGSLYPESTFFRRSVRVFRFYNWKSLGKLNSRLMYWKCCRHEPD